MVAIYSIYNMRCKYESCYQRAALVVGVCKYCQNSHCLKHRLPEEHKCNNMQECKDEAKEKLNVVWQPKKVNEGAYSRGEGGGCRS
jgi:predicted nucleic acid binding AN1-type Zn finger protein